MRPEAGERTLEGIVAAVRLHLDRRLRVGAVLWGGSALALLLLLAASGGGVRWLPLLLDLAFLGGCGAGVFLFRRLRGAWLGDPGLARTMEGAAALPAGAVRGALELARSVPAGGSDALAGLATRRVAGALVLPPRALAGELEEEVARWIRRGSASFALLWAAVVGIALLAPARSLEAWGGLATPLARALTPALPALAVLPGDVEVPRGQPLDVRVQAPGREEVTLHWSSAGELPGVQPALVEGGEARFRLDEIASPVSYWVEAPDGARSPTYRVTPVDPLFLSALRIELTFPAHTGRSPEEHRGDIPPLSLPMGTLVRIEGEVSRTLSRVALEPEDGGTGGIELIPGGRGFAGEWIPRREGRFRWVLEDAQGGGPGAEPPLLELALIPDSLPSVRLTFPGGDTILPPGHRQPLVVEARDDYGLSVIEIVAWRAGVDAEEPRVQRLDAGGSRGAMVRPTLDLSRWGLRPGDTVRYFARAIDNSPGRQAGRTRDFLLRVPGASELREETRARLEEVAERVEELAQMAAAQGEANRALERRNAAEARQSAPPARGGDARPDPMDFGAREEIRQATEAQQGLLNSVDSLGQELQQLAEGMREAGMLDPALRRSLEELNGLLDELASPQLQDRMRRLSESLERNSASEIQDQFQRMTREQEAFREQLESSLERFRQAAAEQELRATTADAEDMMRRQEAVADALEAGDNVALRAEQQEALAREAEAMAERMEALEARLEAAGEEQAASAARSARAQAQAAGERMQRAAREARSGASEEAAREGEAAAEALREAVDELQRGQEEMALEMENALTGGLRRAAAGALTLARRQGELREQMRGADAATRSALRGEEQALIQGVENLAQQLALDARGSPELDREVGRAMGEALRALGSTMSALDAPAGRSTPPVNEAEGAIRALNDLALRAMENARRMEQSSSQGESSSGSQSVQEQLEQLAQQQGELNAQSGQMMPMELGRESLQRQMQQMAQGQEAVAGELGSLANQPGAAEEALGDLSALAEEAALLAQELAGGRMDAETQRRQERLFQRLLDAGRSLEQEEEEESEEREGTSAGVVPRGVVEPLSGAATGQRFPLPPAAELQRLPPAQRQRVLEYFERLNRMEGAARPAPGGGER